MSLGDLEGMDKHSGRFHSRLTGQVLRTGQFYLANHDPDESHKPETHRSNKVLLATIVAGVSARL